MKTGCISSFLFPRDGYGTKGSPVSLPELVLAGRFSCGVVRIQAEDLPCESCSGDAPEGFAG